jgi:predicted ArsR family transcriptional regulator
LETLLRALAEGGVHSYRELAKRLSISPSFLEMMLEDLARQGYLRAVGLCEGNCGGCSVGGCSIAGPRHLWVLTEKGNRASARLAS